MPFFIGIAFSPKGNGNFGKSKGVFGIWSSPFAVRRFAIRCSPVLRTPNTELRTPDSAVRRVAEYRSSPFAGSWFAIRGVFFRISDSAGLPEYRIPNSEPPPSAFRSSPFAGSRFAIRGVFFRISDSAGLPEYRIPNSEPPPSAFRTPPFAGSPVLRTPNTELRTSAFPLPTSDFPNPPTSPPP